MGALVSAPQQQWWCWCMWQRGCGWTGDRVVGVHCAHHLRGRASKSGLLLLRETSIHQIGRMFALTSKGGIKTESKHLCCKLSYLFGIKNAKRIWNLLHKAWVNICSSRKIHLIWWVEGLKNGPFVEVHYQAKKMVGVSVRHCVWLDIGGVILSCFCYLWSSLYGNSSHAV